MAGPWEKYQKAEAAPADGPWSKYKEEKPREKVPEFQAALAGASQGATLGFGDEIYGGLRAGIDKIRGKGNFGDLYSKYRDQNREFNKEAAADNPASFLGGNLAGGAVTTALVPGLGLAKGASLGKAALQGAALGGVTGLGATEGNLSTPDKAVELATDVGTGVVLGGALSGAGKKLGDAVSNLKPESLNAYANKRALTAAGFINKDIKKLSPTQQQEIGQALRSNKIVTALSSLDDVAERAGAAKAKAGDAIGNALTTVDNHVKELLTGIDDGSLLQGATDAQRAAAKTYIVDNFQFNMQNVGKRIREELIAPNADNPLVKNELSRLTGLADDFSAKDGKSLGFGNLVKGTAGKQTKFQSDTVPEEFKQDVYRILKEELETAVGKTGNLEAGVSRFTGGTKPIGDIAARNNQALTDYKGGKSLYAAMKATEKAATDSLGRTNANRTFGLTDTIAAGAGMTAGGPVPAVALGALNKLSRKYGASLQATGAGKLADGIQAVQGVTTDKLASAIGTVLSKNPRLARFNNLIAKAATEGKSSLVAVHFSLMKDPEYSAAMSQDEPSTPMQRQFQRVQGAQ